LGTIDTLLLPMHLDSAPRTEGRVFELPEAGRADRLAA
jgi:hypothetical protein